MSSAIAFALFTLSMLGIVIATYHASRRWPAGRDGYPRQHEQRLANEAGTSRPQRSLAGGRSSTPTTLRVASLESGGMVDDGDARRGGPLEALES
jgi:hypothetical protein